MAIAPRPISSFDTDRSPTVILFGDSRTADCDYVVGPNAYSTPASWWDWGAGSVAGGTPLEVIRNAGVASNTTQQMLDRFAADVLAYAPGYATIWGGTNDAWTSAADVEASFSRMVQMIEMAASARVYLFVISEIVRSSAGGVNFPTYVAYYNDLLRNYCRGRAGCEFWDFNALVVDPASGPGYAKSSMLRDGVHLGPYGASLIGKAVVAAKLARIMGRLTSLVCSQVETRAVSPTARNIMSNPLMTGSGGALGAGSTGTLASNWTSSRVTDTAQTAAISMPDRADGVGKDIQAVVTAAAAGSFFLTQTGDPTRLVAGKTYVLEAALSIASAVNLSSVALTANLYQGGTLYRRGFGYPVQAAASGDTIADLDLVLRSRPFVAPSVAYTALDFTLRAGFAGAGGATIKLGRMSVRQID